MKPSQRTRLFAGHPKLLQACYEHVQDGRGMSDVWKEISAGKHKREDLPRRNSGEWRAWRGQANSWIARARVHVRMQLAARTITTDTACSPRYSCLD